MSMVGSRNSCSLANVLFSDNTNEGSNTKLDSIPKNSVSATRPPRAIVPPKLDSMKTENPKNNTIEV